MASLAFVCFMFGFAMTCFARSIPAGNDERTLVSVDYGGPHTHRPTPYHNDHSKLFPNSHDPHMHPPLEPSYIDSLNLSGNDERILLTVDYGGPRTHPPTSNHDDYSKLFPDYHDPHTDPPTPHHDDHSKLFSSYHDPHTHPRPGPPHGDSLNLSGNNERILLTVDYGGPHTHPPTPHHNDFSKLFPDYHDQHTHPPTPHHKDYSSLFSAYHDPHTHPPPRSPHDESPGLSDNSNRLTAKFDYHPIDPTPQPLEVPETPPK